MIFGVLNPKEAWHH